MYQIPWDAINAKNTAITKTTEEGEKCVGNVVNKILITILMNVNFQINVPSEVVIIRSMQELVTVGN